MGNKLKEATELIQKLVPSIMDLKENCYLEHKKSGNDNIIVNYNDETCIFRIYCFYDEYAEEYDYNQVCTEFRNLGREIHLEDVMLAIDTTNCKYMLSCYSNYCLESPFTEQPDEFYDLLIEGLTTKN